MLKNKKLLDAYGLCLKYSDLSNLPSNNKKRKELKDAIEEIEELSDYKFHNLKKEYNFIDNTIVADEPLHSYESTSGNSIEKEVKNYSTDLKYEYFTLKKSKNNLKRKLSEHLESESREGQTQSDRYFYLTNEIENVDNEIKATKSRLNYASKIMLKQLD